MVKRAMHPSRSKAIRIAGGSSPNMRRHYDDGGGAGGVGSNDGGGDAATGGGNNGAGPGGPGTEAAAPAGESSNAGSSGVGSTDLPYRPPDPLPIKEEPTAAKLDEPFPYASTIPNWMGGTLIPKPPKIARDGGRARRK
jgi:hypothetical protein